jgi:hypothetical protein
VVIEWHHLEIKDDGFQMSLAKSELADRASVDPEDWPIAVS